MMVLFSVLVGGFLAGQISPGVKALLDGRFAAAKMLAVINRKPSIGDNDENDNSKVRLQRENVKGEITFENVEFQYQKKPIIPTTKDDDDSKNEEASEGDLGVSRPVFAGCNLKIKAGETVALGKKTSNAPKHKVLIPLFHFCPNSMSPLIF